MIRLHTKKYIHIYIYILCIYIIYIMFEMKGQIIYSQNYIYIYYIYNVIASLKLLINIFICLRTKKYMHIFLYYITFYAIITFYIFFPPPKKMIRMFWNAYAFQNIFEKKNCIFFNWNHLKDIMISRIIQANIWFSYGKTRTVFINADQ